jgi:hypothetical protein
MRVIERDVAIEACARIAHGALRELRALQEEPFMPAWPDLSPDERERLILRAERLLSLRGVVVHDERFFAAVLRASAAELGESAVGEPDVDPDEAACGFRKI